MLKKSFIYRGFNEKFLDTEFQRLSEIGRDALLAPKSKEKDQKGIHFVITYSKTLPNVKQIINKHWYLLKINSNLRTAFEQEPIIIGNLNLGYLIESKKILNDKVIRKNMGRSNFIVDHALLKEITIVINKFWKQTPSHVTELAKRSTSFVK